jgi:hypothetical protein
MTDLELKKVLINRLVPYMKPVPENAVNEMLQMSVRELSEALDTYITECKQKERDDAVLAHTQELRRASRYDGCWINVLRNVSINGKKLIDADSNRTMMESLLQPHEEPTSAIYATIAKTWPNKFSWETPRPILSDADRQAEFAKICRDNLLSECEANQKLHREGAPLDTWVGASGIERAKYTEEAAQARQQFLIHHATPDQLKAEARFQSATEHDAAVQAEAERSHQFVLSQQGHYPPLPATNANGEVIDAVYLRKISTVNFPLFKQICKKYGSGNVTSRLRNEN